MGAHCPWATSMDSNLSNLLSVVFVSERVVKKWCFTVWHRVWPMQCPAVITINTIHPVRAFYYDYLPLRSENEAELWLTDKEVGHNAHRYGTRSPPTWHLSLLWVNTRGNAQWRANSSHFALKDDRFKIQDFNIHRTQDTYLSFFDWLLQRGGFVNEWTGTGGTVSCFDPNENCPVWFLCFIPLVFKHEQVNPATDRLYLLFAQW